ncbi:hypothetical protein ABTW96_09070 [Nocardia beijingensis]|uniref:hypothetical protein n=1 Tax=Nocardia beijingensis TaxID=95162 RepID=UPI0033348C1C
MGLLDQPEWRDTPIDKIMRDILKRAAGIEDDPTPAYCHRPHCATCKRHQDLDARHDARFPGLQRLHQQHFPRPEECHQTRCETCAEQGTLNWYRHFKDTPGPLSELYLPPKPMPSFSGPGIMTAAQRRDYVIGQIANRFVYGWW